MSAGKDMDMAECELRDQFGNPRLRQPNTRPIARVRGGRSPLNSHVDQRTDNSTNKPMPWVALGCTLGGIGFAMGISAMLVVFIGAPAYIDARVKQAEAEMESRFAQRLASVEANSHNAASISEIWRNRVNKLEAELNANRRR